MQYWREKSLKKDKIGIKNTDNLSRLQQEAYEQEYPMIDLLFREKMKREHRYTTEEDFREYMNKEVYNTISEKMGNKQEHLDFKEQMTDGTSAASITSPYTTLAEMNSKQDED